MTPDFISRRLADFLKGEALNAGLRLIRDEVRSGGTPRSRVVVGVLDAAGRYGEAFDAYQPCNEALLQIHRRFAGGTSVRAYTQDLTAAMQHLGPQSWNSPQPTRPLAEPDRSWLH